MEDKVITWHSHNKRAQCEPNPDYPEGMDIDITNKENEANCFVELPYPAEECGVWLVRCKTCGAVNGATAAGRPDDPKSFKFPCTPRKEKIN